MRLRHALALGVTAATTGTTVLALAVGPSSAEPAPGPAPGADLGARADTEPGAPGADGTVRADEKAPADGNVPADEKAAPGRPSQDPTCGEATEPDFPIATRIHGGPRTYVPGDRFRTFEVDLTNTTAESCQGIHPVLALVDRDRVLQPGQIRMDFYDAGARRWRPVTFEATEEDESVGVFSDASGLSEASGLPDASGLSGLSELPGLPGEVVDREFAGFVVPAGRTVTVPVRLAFREGAAPNEVVANAAIVQRHGDDGDWVGESGAYRLAITPEGAVPEEPESTPAEPTPGESTPGESTPSEATPGETAPPPGDTSPAPRPPGRPPLPVRPELAQTGPESAVVLAPAAGALVLTGAGLFLAARRRRPADGPDHGRT
ncbi:LPXTG cell wall anchor domain-containing protein [Streptomyces sp. NPDC090127]|uniref:LPXTG cell wall anchor domain-containing protein n=1 Tax=Streptomyces sp. NPDC090127 TaxID=3365953 RepID=UPI003816C754